MILLTCSWVLVAIVGIASQAWLWHLADLLLQLGQDPVVIIIGKSHRRGATVRIFAFCCALAVGSWGLTFPNGRFTLVGTLFDLLLLTMLGCFMANGLLDLMLRRKLLNNNT
jgi:hypothetical protein